MSTIYKICLNGKYFFSQFSKLDRRNISIEFDNVLKHCQINNLDLGLLENIITPKIKKNYIYKINRQNIWNITIKILTHLETKTKFSMFNTYCNYHNIKYKIEQVNDKYYLMHKVSAKHPDITDCKKLIKNYIKLYRDQTSNK